MEAEIWYHIHSNNAAINCIPGPPLSTGSGDLPGDSILYFVMSKVQPWALRGTAGDIFLVNPRVDPRPITPGAFGQRHVICGHPGVLDFRPF